MDSERQILFDWLYHLRFKKILRLKFILLYFPITSSYKIARKNYNFIYIVNKMEKLNFEDHFTYKKMIKRLLTLLNFILF
jgi:hypothetical protein